MREKLVKRFYCDHCGKGRFHRKSMSKHEAICIYNPARVCPLCRDAQTEQVAITDLITAVDYTDITPLREKSNHCPACMLSAIVQSKPGADLERDERWIEFNYKAEMNDWYAERNDAIDANKCY